MNFLKHPKKPNNLNTNKLSTFLFGMATRFLVRSSPSPINKIKSISPQDSTKCKPLRPPSRGYFGRSKYSILRCVMDLITDRLCVRHWFWGAQKKEFPSKYKAIHQNWVSYIVLCPFIISNSTKLNALNNEYDNGTVQVCRS